MKAFSLFGPLALVLVLSSCGKDSDPAKADAGAQAATPAPAPAPPGPKADDGHKPQQGGTPDAGFCPVVELAGSYRVDSISCDTDGAKAAPDASAVPTEYVINPAGSVAMKIGANTTTLSFPRNPNTFDEARRTGLFCRDAAAKKVLFQNCPGVAKDCGYLILQDGAKLTATFSRTVNNHSYKCDATLVAR